MGQTGATTLSPTRGATGASRDTKPAERRGDNEHHERYQEVLVDDHDAGERAKVAPWFHGLRPTAFSYTVRARHVRPGRADCGDVPSRGRRILWDVHDGTNAVVVGLEHDKYRRLIVEAPDPKETVQLIENVLKR